MPKGLVRYQQTGHLHFVTFSCYHRRPYLHTPHFRTLFEQSLEAMRERHHFRVIGYVVMPEHVHLLLSEPDEAPLAKLSKPLPFPLGASRPRRNHIPAQRSATPRDRRET